jgi:hypothetical protein
MKKILLALLLLNATFTLSQAQQKPIDLSKLELLKSRTAAFLFAPDGTSILTDSSRGDVVIKETWTGKEIKRFNAGLGKTNFVVTISSSGRYIATTPFHSEKIKKVHLFEAGRLIRSAQFAVVTMPDGDVSPPPPELIFSHDEKVVFVTGIYSNAEMKIPGRSALLALPTLKEIAMPPTNQNSSLQFSGSSQWMLQQETLNEHEPAAKHRLSMVDIKTGNPLWVGNWRSGAKTQVVFSPDGKIFARQLEQVEDHKNRKNWAGVSSINSSTGEGGGWFKIEWPHSQDPNAVETSIVLDRIDLSNRVLLTHQEDGIMGCNPRREPRLFDLSLRKEIALPKRLLDRIKGKEDCYSPELRFSPDRRYLLVQYQGLIDIWGTRDRRAI